MRRLHLSPLVVIVLAVSTALAQQPPAPAGQAQGQGGGQARGGQRQGQPRDPQQQPKGTAAIAGRVLAADTGRPVKRARVLVSGGNSGGRGGGAATTDEQGRYTITGLSAGNYTVTASKSGFVDAVYGQRRPLQAGTPVQLAEGQSAPGVDLRLTRGGVITGHVLDEDGEALPRALVTVQRYQYQRGERQLQPVGGDQTDDRGQFRVFGLPPGDYYVSASAVGLEQLLGRGLQQLAGMAALGGRGGRGAGPGAPFGATAEPEPTGYAPTYFPGVVNAPDAGRVPVAPGQEVSGIDFQIQLVPLATVTGIVVGADEGANVMLTPQDGPGGPLARLGGQMLMGRVQADGTFSITSVPPGRYVAIARAGGGRGGGDVRVGMQPVVVNGQNIEGITLALQPGVTLSGNITVESSGTPAPADYSVFRIDAPEVNPLPFAGGGRGGGPLGGGGRSEKNGTFSVANLLPGLHYIRVTGGGVQGAGQASWTVKSIAVGGQDVSDTPIDIKPGQNIDNVSVVLTDRTTDLSGTVRNAKNEGVPALTVIVFSAEQQYWRPQSRRINAARTDQSGTYRFRNLPPGDYLMVAVDDVEQGEWFDPAYLEKVRPGATRLSISEGEKKTQDLTSPY